MSLFSSILCNKIRILNAQELWGIKSIAVGKFSYSYLTSIELPNTCTYISSYAFAWSKTLKTVILPNTIKNIGKYAFSGCTSLPTITLPNSITAISNGLFNDCTSLSTITLPNSITSIDSSAFKGCTALNNINLHNNITKIRDWAFQDCTSLSTIGLNMNEKCIIKTDAFENASFYTKANSSNLYGANGKILIKAVSTSWPTNIINLAGGSCDKLVTNSILTIPDYIEILGDNPTSLSITKLTLGLNTSYLPSGCIATSVTTLICRQPADMILDLPEAGDGTGLTYKKDARNMTLYTDNESMKNYNWSGDNVTVTIYPLSQAPA